MAGIVHIPWYATLFRGDKLEAALTEIAPLAMRYGATQYAVQRSQDDRYKFLHMSWFDTKLDWQRYWEGPEFNRWRAINSSYYQVPVLYQWHEEITIGRSRIGEEPVEANGGNGGNGGGGNGEDGDPEPVGGPAGGDAAA